MTHPVRDPTHAGQVEQSVAEAAELDVTESQYGEGLIQLLSRIPASPVEIFRALEDLRSMVEATVRREIRALANEMNAQFKLVEAKFEAIDAWFKAIDARFKAIDTRFEAVDAQFKAVDAQFKAIRWLLRVIVALLIAILILLADIALSERRSHTQPPPPPDATLQAPSSREQTPVTGGMRPGVAGELAAPGGNADNSEPSTDRPAR